MDVYVYQEKVRKVKGEELTFLDPIGVLEDYDNEDAALEALLDAEPDFMGVELVIFTQEPQYVTAEEPTAKYNFNRRNGAVVEEGDEEAEEEPEEEEPEAEEEEEAPAPRRRPAAKKASSRAAKKPPAKRPASKAGTRASGGGRRSPFTRNAASAD